ncbi:MAG TPA: hypothetical protein VFP32_02465 [Candidatus Saccharimonadales bacterium]|nr:hypothetical protein [Candidatus Saccharimonadales bacterium]
MAQDEFTKLYAYMQKEFSAVRDKLEEHDKRFDDVIGAVAELAVDIKSYHEELLALGHKVDRLERWIHQIAQETGVKLSLD